MIAADGTMPVLTPEEAVRTSSATKNREQIARPVQTFWQGARRRLFHNPVAVFAMILLVFMLVLIIIGPSLSGAEYLDIISISMRRPRTSHPTAPTGSEQTASAETSGAGYGSAPACPFWLRWYARASSFWSAVRTAASWRTSAARSMR